MIQYRKTGSKTISNNDISIIKQASFLFSFFITVLLLEAIVVRREIILNKHNFTPKRTTGVDQCILPEGTYSASCVDITSKPINSKECSFTATCYIKPTEVNDYKNGFGSYITEASCIQQQLTLPAFTQFKGFANDDGYISPYLNHRANTHKAGKWIIANSLNQEQEAEQDIIDTRTSVALDNKICIPGWRRVSAATNTATVSSNAAVVVTTIATTATLALTL